MSTSSVVLLNIPENWLIGIDLHTFNSTTVFKGIKQVPSGLHSIHWSENDTSSRSLTFISDPPSLWVFRWESRKEEMELLEQSSLEVSAVRSRFPELLPYMVSYPRNESHDAWKELTTFMTMAELRCTIPSNQVVMSTSTSREENALLLKSLEEAARQRAKDSRQEDTDTDPILGSVVDQTGEQLHFIEFNPKISWPPGAIGRERTEWALDKSYLAGKLLHKYGPSYILGEIQLSFVLVILLANYSSSLQWNKWLDLLLNCEELVSQEDQFFKNYLSILGLHMKHCPPEYFGEFIDPQHVRQCLTSYVENTGKHIPLVSEILKHIPEM